MNLNNLYQIQDELDQAIVKKKGLEGQDLLPKKILALQVELGELANEFRGFKFWSEDQEPRTDTSVYAIAGDRKIKLTDGKNPLLEEYVDVLHFILSIGNDLGYNNIAVLELIKTTLDGDLVDQFSRTFDAITEFRKGNGFGYYCNMFRWFIGLGEMLGFTWKQIEQAYLNKNKINHARQESGY